MRSQRRTPQTVTLVHVTTVRTPLGDTTDTTTKTLVPCGIFDPERYSDRTAERAGNDRAPVLQPALWNLPGIHAADSDDLVIEGDATAEDFDDSDAVVWQVVGEGRVWLDRTKIPVQRVRSV